MCFLFHRTDGKILHFGNVSKVTEVRRMNPDKLWPTEMLAPEDDSDTESERTSKEKKKTKVMNHLKKVDMKIKKTMNDDGML